MVGDGPRGIVQALKRATSEQLSEQGHCIGEGDFWHRVTRNEPVLVADVEKHSTKCCPRILKSASERSQARIKMSVNRSLFTRRPGRLSPRSTHNDAVDATGVPRQPCYTPASRLGRAAAPGALVGETWGVALGRQSHF